MRKSLLQFSLTISTSLFALVNTASGQAFVGSSTVNASKSMSLEVATYPVGDSVVITMSGPSNVWFAYGFGGSSMSGTYCMVTDGSGNVTERKLGNHNQGTSLASSLTSSHTSVAGGVRTTVVKRSLTGMNSNYFTFPSGGTSFSIIWAYGFGTNLSSHAGRGATVLNLSLDCANAIDVSVSQMGHVLTANFSNADSYQWLDCSNGFAALSGEVNPGFTASSVGNYAVVISNGGCTDTSACFAINTIGIDENSIVDNVSIFPNPANDQVIVDFGKTHQNVEVILTDLSGRGLKTINEQGVSEVKFSLDQPNGMYLLNITIDGESTVSKPLMVK